MSRNAEYWVIACGGKRTVITSVVDRGADGIGKMVGYGSREFRGIGVSQVE